MRSGEGGKEREKEIERATNTQRERNGWTDDRETARKNRDQQ